MSPEHVRGTDLDHRADIWAFGCILYECLTGGVPFWGDGEYETVLAALNEEPDLSYLPPSTPQEIRELIKGCLVKKRENRIPDMAQVRRTLRQVAERERSGMPQATIGNLPVEVTSFIGRELELERLHEQLATTRILTLTGSGGCGKTRLSLHLARELQKDFRDGVWLIELAALTEPELVEQEIAACFQVKPLPGRTLHDAIVAQLQSRSTLLLFDNCEHLLDSTAEIVDTLARSCPQLKILVTSREALGVPGEVSFRVPSLKTLNPRKPSTLEEKLEVASIKLFVDRAITANPGFVIDDVNQETVAQICYRLDGIPLAIELAAARVRMLSVDQIAAKLDDRFRLLTGGSRTALPRQQTLRALIDWSYDHLTAEEQALLRSLSVFMGEWSFEAALWVYGEGDADELETLDILTRLVDKSLVLVEASAQQVRYRLLETIRQYARDRMLEAGDASKLRRRHLEHYCRFAKEAAAHFGTQDEAIWLDNIEREHDNLREAMDWCFGDDVFLEHGIEIALSMQPFWLVRGYLREGFERLNVAAAKSEDLEPVLRAQADSAMAGMALELGEIDKARQLYMRACVTFVELGDESEAAHAQANVGHACWRLGYLEEAEAHLLGALDVLKRLDRQPRISGILRSLGIIMYRRGDMSAASDYIAEATEIDRHLGNEQGLSGNLQLATLIHMRLGRFNEARRLHEEALAIMQRLNYRPGISMQLINLANLASEDGDFRRSRELLEQALTLARELGRKVTISEALGSLGEIAHRVGDHEEARARYLECLEICEQMKDRQGQARAILGTARIEQELGDTVQAGVDFRRSIELFRECGSILELGMALQEASDYLEKCGNSNGSLAFLGLALREWKQANVSLSPGLRESVEAAVSARTEKLGAERAESLLRNAIGLPLETVLELLAPETEPASP